MNSSQAETTAVSDRASAASIASLVLGIVGVVLSFVLLGIVPGLIGLGIALIARRRCGASRRMANWGAAVSAVAITLAVTVAALFYWLIASVQETMENSGGSDWASWEGVQAPDLTVKATDGRELKLSDLKGRRVIVDFWATWCGPCVREIPHFAQLYRQTSRDQLEIIGISSEDTDTVVAFAKKKQVPYPLGSAVNLTAPYDGIEAIPTTLFIDRRGVIQKVVVGYHDLDTLRSYALAPDTEGEPRSAPARPATGLTESPQPLEATVLWQAE